ncbi:1-phosphofructokinase [Peloplasma aerotolerans]|uniref:1-phosphofructokinase n=1 Tax=Peloplasma aerotolerans TaxID=3044389 RepID=A0AAW6UAX3_9MOLU|nr:1-phosphofructokinase [Mariniplasma sp. M4Ah]MDI6453281.1 1-phosphofructokinase [Mariniplasma sp. M4Ah]
MIYTCTLNPAIDYHIEVDKVNIGKLNRTDHTQFLIGGKGINVSLVLKHLGVESIPIGFIGGFTGDFIKKQLREIDIHQYRFIEINGETRINVKIKDHSNETELNSLGPDISDIEWKAFTDIIKQLSSNDTLICSGSLPKGIPNAYQEIAGICQKNNVSFIMDTPGVYYDQFLSYQPILVKPNLNELSTYFNTQIKTIDEIVHYGKELIKKGAKKVLISFSAEGSLLITEDKIYQANPIKGISISSIGSGDSMVAGFIYQHLQTINDHKAYQYAVAAATATAFKKGLANQEDIEKYLILTTIKELNI